MTHRAKKGEVSCYEYGFKARFMQRDALKKHKKAASDLEISVLASGVLGSTAATHPDILSNNLDKKLTVEADKSQRSRHPPPGVFGVLDTWPSD